MVTVETAKQYLRVDSSDEDTLIENLISTSQKLCKDVMRQDDLEPEDFAVLYTVAYLYEHREEADHKALMETLRALLFADRREVF